VSPVIVGNVVYQAVNGYAGDDPSYLEARDLRTGKRLWRLRLPHGLGDAYLNGPSVSGTVLVLPYAGGNHRRSGLTAVDIRTRKVLWTRSRSPFDAQDTSGTGGPAVVDAGRIHLLAGLDLSSYDLRTGRALWRKKAPGRGFGAIAAAGGKLYASSVGAAGESSLVVYDGRTGKKLWSVIGLDGRPVVAGGLVLMRGYDGVAAVSAAGCGQADCRPRWTRALPDTYPPATEIGAADSSTLYVTTASVTDRTSRLVRLSTRTGRVQWSVTRPYVTVSTPIRASNVVWVFENATTITGWQATSTRKTPLRSIRIPSDEGVLATLSVAGGTLIHASWPDKLIGYRIASR
jgi:outer membrane protein assembly factor BamB